MLSVCVGCGTQVKTETNPTGTDLPPKVAEEQPVELATTETTNPPIYVEPKTYEEVLDSFYDEIAFPNRKDRNRTVRFKVNGLSARAAALGDTPEEQLNEIGYCIEDISGDGIPELIIGVIRRNENRGTRIISLYTMVDGEALIARNGKARIIGWGRNRYYLLGEGLLYHEGSSGAQYSFHSIEQISKDGTSVKTLEVFATYIYENGVPCFGNYHLIYDEDGDYTVEEKDKNDNSDKSEWRSRSECMNRTLILDLIPMSEYKPSQK